MLTGPVGSSVEILPFFGPGEGVGLDGSLCPFACAIDVVGAEVTIMAAEPSGLLAVAGVALLGRRRGLRS